MVHTRKQYPNTQLPFTRKLPTLESCRRAPIHFTKKNQETIFVENFIENIIWQMIFVLKMRFYLKKKKKKRQKTEFW